jgi:nitroreductase
MRTNEANYENPWEVKEADFPANGTAEDKLRFLLNYAVLAPSGHNTQPWQFKIVGDELEVYADRLRALPVVDPEDREMIMSCGAALFHLRIALFHYGCQPVVRTVPDLDDPDLMAFLRIGTEHETTLEEHHLFAAIKKRRTYRLPFEKKPVEPLILVQLREAVSAEGARLHILADEERRKALVDLITAGDRIQGSDLRFRRELAAWVHPNRSKSRDGIPGYAKGAGDFASYAGPLVVRTFDWGGGRAAQDRTLAEGSPLLLIISTENDGEESWLRAGQGLARLLLQAAYYDLYASFLNQPIEVLELRPDVAALIEPGARPQVILRMGYGHPARATPRRPVHEVLSRLSLL